MGQSLRRLSGPHGSISTGMLGAPITCPPWEECSLGYWEPGAREEGW